MIKSQIERMKEARLCLCWHSVPDSFPYVNRHEKLSDNSLNTYQICDSLLSKIGAGSFVPLQKSRWNHSSYVWTEVLVVRLSSLRRGYPVYREYSLNQGGPPWFIPLSGIPWIKSCIQEKKSLGITYKSVSLSPRLCVK